MKKQAYEEACAMSYSLFFQMNNILDFCRYLLWGLRRVSPISQIISNLNDCIFSIKYGKLHTFAHGITLWTAKTLTNLIFKNLIK